MFFYFQALPWPLNPENLRKKEIAITQERIGVMSPNFDQTLGALRAFYGSKMKRMF